MNEQKLNSNRLTRQEQAIILVLEIAELKGFDLSFEYLLYPPIFDLINKPTETKLDYLKNITLTERRRILHDQLFTPRT